MRLGEIRRPKGSVKSRKRLGRGPGSGTGKTSGKGHKGQKARSGYKFKAYSEGGQMPLQRRLPKRGFVNIFKTEFQPVNLEALSQLEGNTIKLADIYEAGLASKKNRPVKILGQGDISRAINVSAHAFSKTAIQKIEAAGGKVEVIQ
ncbi:MAG: 50S ribosomal protein L15 [candidate division Zixibacteria bacterium CG_4_9_14_3_um_filter_46_8]|nr:MAG: 50S ribosomal protein L15 [candidate division Zixibacteria bacterium CG_4_9_14_3_um_filter_46_8]